MANTKVAENRVTVNGIKYYRGNALAVSIGDYGEKDTPVFGQNYLQVKSRINLNGVKVTSKPVSIDFSGTSSADFGANVTAWIKGVKTTLTGSQAISKIQSGALALLMLQTRINDLKKAANESSRVLNNLKDYKSERIVSEVLMVIDAETSTTITNSTDVKLTGAKASAELNLSVKIDSTKTTNVTFHPGTCFAYMLVKPKWKMKFLKKDSIEDLDMDQWGT